MKKIWGCFSALIVLLLLAGCDQGQIDKDSRAINQHTLNYAISGNGIIEGLSPQTVAQGENGHQVTAVPAEDSIFTGWSDGITSATRTDQNVTADIAVTAGFAIKQFSIEYTADEHGSIDGPAVQNVSYGGEGVLVTAVPDSGYRFVSWSDGVATASRVDTALVADLAVTAKFAIKQFSLVYSAVEHGSIEGPAVQSVSYGSDGAVVVAVPDSGYRFVSWSDGVTTASRADTEVMASLALTASFAILQHTLSYGAAEHGVIEGNSLQVVLYGADGSAVTAVADQGHRFVAWSDGLITNQRIDSNVTGDLAVTAIFGVSTYTVGGIVSGLVGGTQLVLQNNAGDDLVITDNGAFSFANELEDADGYMASILAQPTSPNQTCKISGGSGAIPGGNVTNILVSCALNTYSIGGTFSGLAEGEQVVLQINESDDLAIVENGDFVFNTQMVDGSDYRVTVRTYNKKKNRTCDIENAEGTLAGMDAANVTVYCYTDAVMQARAGIKSVNLDWNSLDFSEATFRLCRAQEEIPPGGVDVCNKLKGGVLDPKVLSPWIVSPLVNDIPYWFQLEVRHAGGHRVLSDVVMATPYGGLNDSGIDWCADDVNNLYEEGQGSSKGVGCETIRTSYPDQDALVGRDALSRDRKLAKAGSGSAGFDFTKVCRSGELPGDGKCSPNPLPGDKPNNWGCVLDNVTGLLWELKKDSGLQSQNNTYSWYNPDATVNGGYSGQKNGGYCVGSNCDTQAYAKAINDMALCGVRDWRLPTRRELLSIVDNGRFDPTADKRFFPKVIPSNYWTSSPYADQQSMAWQVYFKSGEASPSGKWEHKPVRLVRGRTVTFGLDNP